jgi:hypothetical protein
MASQSTLCERQRFLIERLQKNKDLTDEEGSELVVSLRGIVVDLAKKFQPSFPLESLNELISEGMYALWNSFFKYDTTRAMPSTFCYRVVATTYMKKWHKQKNRKVKIKTSQVDENGDFIKIIMPAVSLDCYLEEHGDMTELGVFDDQDGTESCFREILQFIYDKCCSDIRTYEVLNCIFNSDTFEQKNSRCKRQILQSVADKVGVTCEFVGDIIEEIKENVDDSLIRMMFKYDFVRPRFEPQLNYDICEYFFKNDLTDDICDIFFKSTYSLDVMELLS